LTLAETLEHGGGGSPVLSLPGGQLQQNGQAVGVDEGMIFVSVRRASAPCSGSSDVPAEDGVSSDPLRRLGHVVNFAAEGAGLGARSELTVGPKGIHE
jgi:hypothetical protein